MFRGIAIGNSFRKVATMSQICKENLIFNPTYLTDTEWVSKTDAVPVLSLNGIDNFVTTPITINANLNIELQFRYNQCNNGVTYQYIYGRYLTNSQMYAAIQTSNNLLLFGYGNDISGGGYKYLVDKGIYTLKLIDKKFYFNDVLLKDFTHTPFVEVSNVFMIFGGFSSSQRTCIDLMYCKLWDSTQEALYTFDNISGTVIPDKSGNGNDAILGGSLTYCCSKRRVLLNNEDRTYLSKSNIEKVKAKLVDNNCVYLNGTTSKASTTFTNDILYYLDKLTMFYSEDGIILKTWETGDISVQGLLQIDLENRTLTIGFDGTNYKEMFLIGVVCEYNNSVELIKWFDITTSSGSEIEEYNRTMNENEWSGLAPFNDFSFAALDTELSF